MDVIITLGIIMLGIVLIVWIVNHYNSKKPQNKCNHSLNTIQTYKGTRSNEFLSTCTKCGYQKTNNFCGLN